MHNVDKTNLHKVTRDVLVLLFICKYDSHNNSMQLFPFKFLYTIENADLHLNVVKTYFCDGHDTQGGCMIAELVQDMAYLGINSLQLDTRILS